MRALCLALLVACSTPAPPPAQPPAPAAPAVAARAPEPSGPSWVGVRVDEKAVRITQVIKDAPADKAGLRIGDEIVSVNGTPITTGPAFVERVRGTKNGDKLSIVVVRGGGKITLDVIVAPRPQSIA